MFHFDSKMFFILKNVSELCHIYSEIDGVMIKQQLNTLL